ncbi:MAG: hypothetical protein ABI624_05055 [Casimicrobiaceae bacterium]
MIVHRRAPRQAGSSAGGQHEEIRMKILDAIVAMVVVPIALSATVAEAQQSFRFRQLYSSQDGVYQFVELEEVEGQDGQNFFLNLQLVVTNRHGTQRTFVFPRSFLSTQTARRRVLIASNDRMFPGLHDSIFVQPDYLFPKAFLPTDGGTIEISGVDRWTFPALPVDGNALLRDGTQAPADALTFFLNRARPISAGLTTVREFYNPMLNEYFISGSQPDLAALDDPHSGWQGTYEEFEASSVSALASAAAFGPGLPVCRYYLPPPLGDTHFYSVSPDECDAIAKALPGAVLETAAAFYAWLPDPVTGYCPATYVNELTPVYRLWDGTARNNHRYTVSLAARDSMVAQGWIAEGYGPQSVAMCTA